MELLPRLAAPPLEVAPAVLDRLADADSPRGVLAVAALPRAGAEAVPVHRSGVYVFAEALQEPGNLGALARVAEAAGATGLFLGPGSAHPNHPRALRASAGSLLRLPVAVDADVAAVEARLAPLHPRWVALVPRGGVELYGALLERSLVLMLGSEGAGLSAALEERADLRLTHSARAAGRVAQRHRGGRHRAVRGAPPADRSGRGGAELSEGAGAAQPRAFASRTAAVSAGMISCTSPTIP